MPEKLGYGNHIEVSIVEKEDGKKAYQITFYPRSSTNEYIEPTPIIYDSLDDKAVSDMKSFLQIKKVIIRKKMSMSRPVGAKQ